MADNSRHLDPRAQAAVDHIRANSKHLTGPILLRNLPAALPPRDRRHGWREAITVFLLCELVGVHRVPKGRSPFWRGVLYQVARRELAHQFACDPDMISAALKWLQTLGLVVVVHRTRVDDTGKPGGTDVFAVPRMDRLRKLLDFFVENGRAMTASELIASDPLQQGSKSLSMGSEVPSKNGSSRSESSEYLNCPKRQQKHDAESAVVASLERAQAPEHEQRRRGGAGGGGGADAEIDRQIPPAPSAVSPRSATGHRAGADSSKAIASRPSPPRPSANAHGANGHSDKTCCPATKQPAAAAAPRWQPPAPPADLALSTAREQEAWARACNLCSLWEQAIERLDWITPCSCTPGDRQAAYEFFIDHPQTSSFYVAAAAIDAWGLTRKRKTVSWDRLYHVRTSLEFQSFLRSFRSGKLQSEIGQHGIEINAWLDLRTAFTQSELIFYRWDADRIPMLAMDPEALWEMDPEAPAYYQERFLPLPIEIQEALRCRKEGGKP